MGKAVQQYLRRRAAQGISDYLKIYTPSDIRGMLDSLKSSYEVLNQTAKGQKDWDVAYAEFQTYYTREYDRNGLTYSQATVDNIKQREREFAEWQNRLKQRGLDVGPIRRPDEPSSSGDLGHTVSTLAEVGLGAGLLYVLYKLVT